MASKAAGRQPLSRQRILDTALAIVDREGIQALSMRRLAADLDVEPMSLYRYADGKEGVHEGLVELVFAEAHAVLDADPAGESPTARGEMHRIGLALYRVAVAHPHVLPLLTGRLMTVPLARRPASVLRLPERVLARLAAEGVPDGKAVGAYRAFSAWVLGYVIVDLRAVVDQPEEVEPALRYGLYQLRRDYPALRHVAPLLAEGGGEGEFLTGLDALLDWFDID
jgi:AcrR family transcriptional regulator